MNHYSYYGLNVLSDLVLPELHPGFSDVEADAIVQCDSVPSSGLKDAQQLGPFLQAVPQKVWLNVPGIARFLIQNGNEIIYEPQPGIDEASVRVFILGSCTGALLFQKGYLVLHGNAFEAGDSCVVCVGKSGMGKSTLAAALLQRGYRIIADDVCPVDAEGRAIPGMPRIKLWQDSADKLGIETSVLQRIRPQLQKYNFPLDDAFCTSPKPVKAVYILDSHNSKKFTLERIEGMDKYSPLRNNTYRYNYVKGMGMSKQHLQHCGQFAARTNLSRLQRPQGTFQVEELADFILADLADLKLGG